MVNLIGTAGNDALTGGDASDTFQFGKVSGHDTITDFNADEGTLNFSYLATRFESVADVVAVATAQTEGAVRCPSGPR
ncbi:hypothetical protein [Kordiimonas marina]|uniref:hypothetical protein n=1 Tax=Kordiimonas marina TaxID=2872312 RepID=UPI001FF19EDC|nr:hypothetical protein [Kordiimonas marina]MCJ9429372.1 hypothetical protein [Kordiimonas marina]